MAKINTTMSEYNFGQIDAKREYTKNKSFFLSTFIDPISLSMSTLNNKQNFIILGTKGSGKTAALLKRMNDLSNEGFITHFISFDEDITKEDTQSLASAQSFSFLNFDSSKIYDIYDFREIWKRSLLGTIAQSMDTSTISNPFTQFMLSSKEGAPNFLQGISKGLKVSASAPTGVGSLKLDFDLSKMDFGTIDLVDFNKIALALLHEHCTGIRFFGVVDKLIISQLNTEADEYRIKCTLIRDMIKSCAYLNDDFAEKNLEIHFICNLRPEIRDLLNRIDAEIGKITDDSDARLNWYNASDENPLLLQFLKKKIAHGAPNKIREDDIEQIIPKNIHMGGRTESFTHFLAKYTWHRPRDIVRFLKSYAKFNPHHTDINVDGIKNSLNEYGRTSAKEMFDEMSVNFGGSDFALTLSRNIKKRNYSDLNDLFVDLEGTVRRDSMENLANIMFDCGAIGNFKDTPHGQRHFWKHYGEEFLDPGLPIRIHPGLWDYFNVRH